MGTSTTNSRTSHTGTSARSSSRSANTRAGTFVDGLTTVVSDRHREISLLVGFLTSAFSMVSLLGYEAGDPTLLHPGDTAVANPCGPVGALIADLLFSAVGHGAWAMFFAMVACVMALAGRFSVAWTRAALGAASYAFTLTLLHLAFAPGTSFPPGGVFGRTTAEVLRVAVGGVGAWMVVLGSLLLLVTLLFHIRWSVVAARVVGEAEAWLPHVQTWARSGSERVGGLAGQVGRAGLRGSAAGVRGGGLAVWRGVDGVARTFRRMGRSFTRREGEVDPEEFDFDSDLDDLTHNPETHAPSDEGLDDRTALGMPVALAEVQWEPTAELAKVAGPVPGSADVLDMFPQLAPRSTTSEGGSQAAGGTVPGTQVGSPFDRDEPTSPSDAPPPTTAPVAVPVVRPAAVASVRATPAPAQRAAEPAASVRASDPPSSVEVRAAAGVEVQVQDNGRAVRQQKKEDFQLPQLKLLNLVPKQHAEFDAEALRRLARVIEETLSAFKIPGEVTDVRVGPVVTTFEFLPAPGIKVSRVSALSDDLALALKVESVRVELRAEKGVIGVEIPSPQRMMIVLRELLASETFRNQKMALPCIIGKDVEGRPIVSDLAKMPHMLVGGTTGSGKSVGVNGMLLSMLFARTPDELRLLLVDPKILEFKLYEDIPHLIHPVVTDPKKAAAALAWACREMDDRYALLASWDVRNIEGYNAKVKAELEAGWTIEKSRKYCPADEEPAYWEPRTLPYIVIVIDELADLMMQARKEVEESIARIAQKARASGIHLIVATQRPSADIVTGLIKSNLPTRLSFKLKSALDSRVILDENGAERLLGKGDCLLSPNGSETMRCHGAFVEDDEVFRVVEFLRSQGKPEYIEAITADSVGEDVSDEQLDDLYDEAVAFVREKGKASTSLIQRQFKIGYNRAANIIDQLEARGVVGPADGARPREVIV